jgi:hypothetical protein
VIAPSISYPAANECILRPGNEVGRWARQFLSSSGSIGSVELLTRLSQGIKHGFLYRRREAKGIQPPLETLRLGHGSCRDFAVLMIEAARSLGLAARFASGYLAVPLKDPEEPPSGRARGSTHAWAQIYLPGAGWIHFDPWRGSVGRIGLVTVAIVRDPHHAIPLHGTFIGSSSDHLDMEVQVSITPGTPLTLLFYGICDGTSKPAFKDERARVTAAIFWMKTRGGWSDACKSRPLPLGLYPQELPRHRIDLGEIYRNLLIAAPLTGDRMETAARERLGRACTAKMDYRGKLPLLLRAGRRF